MSLSFDTKPQEIPVTIDGHNYTLREASGWAATQWRNAVMKGLKIATDPTTGTPKVVGFQQVDHIEALLVSLCLFNDKGENVPLETIQGWPYRVVRDLYQKAAEISQVSVPSEDLIDQETADPLTQ